MSEKHLNKNGELLIIKSDGVYIVEFKGLILANRLRQQQSFFMKGI